MDGLVIEKHLQSPVSVPLPSYLKENVTRPYEMRSIQLEGLAFIPGVL